MLNHSASQLRLHVRVFEVNHRDGDPRIALGVSRLEGVSTRPNHQPVPIATNPDRSAMRRSILHQRGQVSEVSAINELFHVVGQSCWHGSCLHSETVAHQMTISSREMPS